MKLDSNGTKLWVKSYTRGIGDQGSRLLKCSNGDYVCVGFSYKLNMVSNIYEQDAIIQRTDNNGNLLYRKFYGSDDNDILTDIVQHDNFFYAIGNYTNVVVGGSPPRIISKNQQGWLLKFDTAGNILSDKKIDLGMGNLSDEFTKIITLDNGGFLISGHSEGITSTSTQLGTLTKIDTAGNILWKRSYNFNASRFLFFYDLKPTLDGGFIMTGTGLDAARNNNQDVWVVKVDSMGCEQWQCSGVGIEEEKPQEKPKNALHIYPNPATDWVNVDYTLPDKQTNATLLLKTLQGTRLDSYVLKNNEGTQQINCKNYENGVYVLQLALSNGVVLETKSLVLIK